MWRCERSFECPINTGELTFSVLSVADIVLEVKCDAVFKDNFEIVLNYY